MPNFRDPGPLPPGRGVGSGRRIDLARLPELVVRNLQQISREIRTTNSYIIPVRCDVFNLGSDPVPGSVGLTAYARVGGDRPRVPMSATTDRNPKLLKRGIPDWCTVPPLRGNSSIQVFGFVHVLEKMASRTSAIFVIVDDPALSSAFDTTDPHYGLQREQIEKNNASEDLRVSLRG